MTGIPRSAHGIPPAPGQGHIHDGTTLFEQHDRPRDPIAGCTTGCRIGYKFDFHGFVLATDQPSELAQAGSLRF